MKNFTRTIENFVCENCGTENLGNGYTNHCFVCLWSKHVDIIPGDRANECKGLMEPIGYDQRDGILHRCTTCKLEKNNKLQSIDNLDIAITLSALMPS
jgi:hypothetical protein